MTASKPAPTASPAPARILWIEDRQQEDLTESTTVQERFAMVATLSRRMWEISGCPWPSYNRTSIPVEIIRPR